MKNVKAKRAVFLSLSILFTLLAILAAFGLSYAAREMAHEGLTYSQWYEGTISTYYGWLRILTAVIGLCLCCWCGFVFSVRPFPRLKKGARITLKIIFILCLLLTCLFVFRSFSSHAYLQAMEAQAESLAPYIETYGQNRLWALIALEAAVFSILPVAKGK